MKSDQAATGTSGAWQAAETIVILLLFYLYAWWVVDPRLIHHSLGLFTEYSTFAFSSGWAFFRDHLVRPGGLVEYTGALLSQYFCFAWLGALILTLLAGSLCLLTDLVIRQAGQPPSILRYLPAAVLLAAYGRYDHPIGTILAVIVGLACFAIYLHASPDKTTHRLLVLLLLVTVGYHLAGAGMLVFPLLAAIHEVSVRCRKSVAAVALLLGLSVPWLVGILRFGLSPGEAYGRYLLADPGLVRAHPFYGLSLLLFFPLALGATVLARAAYTRWALSKQAPGRGSLHGTGPGWRAPVRSGPLARAAFVLAGMALVAWLTLDGTVRALIEMDRDSQRGDWKQVLAGVERIPRGQHSARMNRNVAMALYHLGLLGEKMFSYPQVRGMHLFRDPEGEGDHGALFQESRIYFELGQLNYAEKCAYDSLGVAGDVPAVLEHLAAVSTVRGRIGAARTVLNALRKNPFYRTTADGMLRQLPSDPRLEEDPRVALASAMRPDSDSFTQKIDVESVLASLLNKDRGNRMAFEFLMAYYLVEGRPEKVAEHLGRLKDLGYGRMPRHYQEALVIGLGADAAKLRAAPFSIEPDVFRRFQAFLAIVGREPDQRLAARDARAAGLGDSYFYFLSFGASGSLVP